MIEGTLDNTPAQPMVQAPQLSAEIVDKVYQLDQYKDGFDIQNPLELLYLLDEDVQRGKGNGGMDLHDWQKQFLLDFAHMDFVDQNPFQAVVRAANGSGKDKYIIAPCVVWLCMRYRLARGVVTSSSGVQLDNQTCAYIEYLCMQANRKFAGGKELIWKCNYRYYECLCTKSPVICYATDEPGKAEGFHPLGFARKMCIMVSEDKSVPDDINLALNKCTGYTHRVHVSTPGLPMGHFFDLCSTAVKRNTLRSVSEVRPEDYIEYHVTAYDCSHIPKAYIEQMKRDLPGGETGAAFKSQVLAEFGTTDEMVVIPYTYVWRSFGGDNRYPLPKHLPETYNKAGLDLSDGGDETVLVVRNGNKILKILPFKFDNTEDTIEFLDEQFRENNLNHPEAYIWADCGGLGKPMLNRLKRMGWSNIRFVDNRSAPFHKTTYVTRGTEMWFDFRKLLERHELIIEKNDRLIRQLSTRYYKIRPDNKHILLSKLESRSRGYPSPDRADATVLCFSDYKSTKNFLAVPDEKKPYKLPVAQKPVNSFTLQEYSSNTRNTPTKMLGKKPDNSYLLQQIEAHNQQIKLRQKELEEQQKESTV
jgi:hypothetical protein